MNEFLIDKDTYNKIMVLCKSKQKTELEICGFLIGDKKRNAIIEMDNIAEDNRATYLMNPMDMFNTLSRTKIIDPKATLELKAIWHSHHIWEPTPSPMDLRIADYPVPYLIWGKDKIKAYKLEKINGEKKFVEIQIKVK